MKLSVIILAAGQGVRMKSKKPKVAHQLGGRPMVQHVIDVARQLSPERPALVVGHGMEQVRHTLGEEVLYVEQREQLGTGHAVLQARDQLAGRQETVLVLYGDTPLIRLETLRRMGKHHQQTGAAITILTFLPDDPYGYGRILRHQGGRVLGIVEHKAATAEQRQIRESNSGILCFDDKWLWPHLESVERSEQGEYYLTDLVGMAVAAGKKVEALLIEDATEVMGINTRLQLAQAEAVLRRRINEGHMLAGVTLIDPATTYIEIGVQIGQDTIIYPDTYLQGETRLGQDCVIGPNTIIRDSTVGDGCVIQASVLEEALLEEEVRVGPFAHMRPGAHLGRGVYAGNYAEVKKSYLGPGTKMHHFSYVGDATIGEEVNVGAGTITCNYDGQRKHPTIIEDGAFIGSDTMLVAPVRIGAGAKTGAGAVVTRDVPPHSVAYGVPARAKDTEQDQRPKD